MSKTLQQPAALIGYRINYEDILNIDPKYVNEFITNNPINWQNSDSNAQLCRYSLIFHDYALDVIDKISPLYPGHKYNMAVEIGPEIVLIGIAINKENNYGTISLTNIKRAELELEQMVKSESFGKAFRLLSHTPEIHLNPLTKVYVPTV